MTEIYIVRHAEAEGNTNRMFQGSVDTNISENGEKQLERLMKRALDFDVDKIYSSPLKRAQKTAEAFRAGEISQL